ncbi:MAG: STAS domain-containing protein [Pirellulaceae bacterium]|jgi:anti-anti-sigma factor|nr:STAS domain-containing protein [Pirellulaceae bacterium]
MLLAVTPDWSLDIDRGPDWLFVRLRPPRQGDTGEIPLAEMIWERLEQEFCHRVVLELDDVTFLRSWLVGQLVLLHKRVASHEGMMRLCGVSRANEDVLRACRLDGRFPAYRNRTDAVMGHRPPQPR